MDEVGIFFWNIERLKDWYKIMFKQIYKLNRDDDLDLYFFRYLFFEDIKFFFFVFCLKSEMSYIDGEKVVKRLVMFFFLVCFFLLKLSLERNDWEFLDKKVDIRKYCVEFKSIYEYQLGKFFVLINEKMSLVISFILEIFLEIFGYIYFFNFYVVKRELDGVFGDFISLENER